MDRMPCTNEYVPVNRLATHGVVDDAEAMACVQATPEQTSRSSVGVRARRPSPNTASARRQSISRNRTFGGVMLGPCHAEDVSSDRSRIRRAASSTCAGVMRCMQARPIAHVRT